MLYLCHTDPVSAITEVRKGNVSPISIEEFYGALVLIIEPFMDSMHCFSLCTRGEVYLILKSEGGLPLSVNKQ